jgi:hypothetical protein
VRRARRAASRPHRPFGDPSHRLLLTRSLALSRPRRVTKKSSKALSGSSFPLARCVQQCACGMPHRRRHRTSLLFQRHLHASRPRRRPPLCREMPSPRILAVSPARGSVAGDVRSVPSRQLVRLASTTVGELPDFLVRSEAEPFGRARFASVASAGSAVSDASTQGELPSLAAGSPPLGACCRLLN